MKKVKKIKTINRKGLSIYGLMVERRAVNYNFNNFTALL